MKCKDWRQHMYRKNAILIFTAVLVMAVCIRIAFDYSEERKTSQVYKRSVYTIFVEVEDNTLYLLQDGKCIKKYAVSSGRPQWPSPIGTWKITDKGEWGEGFGGRWMGLNVSWGR